MQKSQNNLKILNRKEVKEILEKINTQWDCEITGEDIPYVFLINDKDKIYIVNKDIERVDFAKLRINSMGMYFGENMKGHIRLTIEGSQLIGPKCKKNIIELDEKDSRLYQKGVDIDYATDITNFAIIKNKKTGDYLGCGKPINGKILNHTSKVRRIMASD